MALGSDAPEVAVIGGGLVGLCSALALQRAGLSTLLVDPVAGERPASFGNAGHIALEQVRPLASPEAVRGAAGRLFAFGGPLDFRLSDAADWGGWALRYLGSSGGAQAAAGERALCALLKSALPAWRRLVGGLGHSDLLQEKGHIVAWEGGDTAAKRAHWTSTSIGEAKVREITERERLALASALARPPVDAIAFEGTAQVASPAAAMAAIADAFRESGGARLPAKVRRLRREGGRAVFEADGRELRPGLVMVSAGVGSGRLMGGLGHVAPVVAERGYHIEADAPAWPDLPPVAFEDRSVIATRFAQRLRLAGFVEFARPEAPADPRKWARLERHAAELGLPMQGDVARWVGARPTLPDYLPAIGRSRRVVNLVYAFGHQHLGLTLAPLTGELVAALATGAAPAVPLDPFDLDRFASRARRASP